MRQCRSKSRARRRLRLIHPMVRSTVWGTAPNALRQHDEILLVAAADDLDLPRAGAGDGGGHLRPLIARVSDDALDEGEQAACETACKPFQIPWLNSVQRFPPRVMRSAARKWHLNGPRWIARLHRKSQPDRVLRPGAVNPVRDILHTGFNSFRRRSRATHYCLERCWRWNTDAPGARDQCHGMPQPRFSSA